jgi:hypothetical protein
MKLFLGIAIFASVSCSSREEMVSLQEQVSVGLSLEPQQDSSFGVGMSLLEGDEISVKYAVSGCASGFTKTSETYVPSNGLSIKFFRNDKGCKVVLTAIKMQAVGSTTGQEYVIAAGNPQSALAAASEKPSADAKYYINKSNPNQRVVVSDVQFSLSSSKSSTLKFAFRMINGDSSVKSVSGVGSSQTLGSAALEAPNFEIPTGAASQERNNNGLRFSSYGSVYSGGAKDTAEANGGFQVDVKYRCAGNVSLGGTGSVTETAACPTAAGDSMKVHDLQLALVMCRSEDNAISLTEAESLFKAVPTTRILSAPTSLASVIKAGADFNSKAAADFVTGIEFRTLKAHFPVAAVAGTTVPEGGCKINQKIKNKGWLLLRKTAGVGDLKVSSFLVTNVELALERAGVEASAATAGDHVVGEHGAIVFKSIGNAKGTSASDLENPRKFFQIPYANRLKDKGDCKLGNCYNPSLYLSYPGKKMLITDTLTNPDGSEVVLFTATVGGINKETMSFIDPSFKTGNKEIYNHQLAAGWSSSDYDADSYSANCSATYAQITQHYGSCWYYSIGSDAEGDHIDGDWGPHFYKPQLPAGAKGMDGDTSTYVRVKGITRYIKPLEEKTTSFFTEDIALWIAPNSDHGTVAYRSVANTNGANASDVQMPNKFFRISYSERLTDKGDCNSGNCYKPSAYEIAPGKKLLVTDTVMGGDGVERVVFSAKIGGLDKNNMKILDPEFMFGNRSVYDSQLAAGWASYDADFDTHGSANCAQYYGQITQHYSACWNYSLGADADGGSISNFVSPNQAENWGPHFYTGTLPSGSVAERADGSSYVRVRMITRYVKALDEASPSFFTELASVQIPTSEEYGEILYRSVANTNRNNAADAKNPLKFFNIPYSQRLTDKGDCKNATMCYRPSLYSSNLGKKLLITDTIVGSDGVERVLFKAKIGGIDSNTMRVRGAEHLGGNVNIFSNQLSMGWAANDYDVDSWDNNCAKYYSGITQHYGACWVYNLGSDADADYVDEQWGPHIHGANAPAGFKPERMDGSAYVRARAITRYVKKLDEVANTFYTEKAKDMIPTNPDFGSILYRSVANTFGEDVPAKDDPLKFFNIPYAQRLTDKGDCADGSMCYRPSLYTASFGKKIQVTDTVVGSDGRERVLMIARAAGIDSATMKFKSPEFIEGNRNVYDNQFAAGWASSDYDSDSWASNCASFYSNVSQHYGACWVYNLASDADGTFADLRWGPHVHGANLPAGTLSEDGDTSAYVRVRAITRYVKQIDDPVRVGATLFVDAEQTSPLETVSASAISTSASALRDTANFAAGSASLGFSGGNHAKLNLPGGLGNGAWTVEGWFYLKAVNSTYQMFLSSYDSGSLAIGVNGTELVMGVNGPAGGDKYKEWHSPTWDALSQTPIGVKPELNKWYHFALVYTGSEYLCFVDGKLKRLVSSDIKAAPFSIINLGSGWGYFGTNNSYPSNVNLDNIAITVGKAKYTSNFTPEK